MATGASKFHLRIPLVEAHEEAWTAEWIAVGVTGAVLAAVLAAGLKFLSTVWPLNEHVLLAAILTGVAVYCALAYRVFESYRSQYLDLTAEGLSFPGSLGNLFTRQRRAWTELTSIDCAPGRSGSPGAKLILNFRSAQPLVLRPEEIPIEELDRLLAALEWLGHDRVNRENLRNLRNALQSGSHDFNSYTRLWQEELSRRFHSTSFVPLPPSHLMQAGYRIIRQLAFGGFSAVYLAEKPGEPPVVLKESVVPAGSDTLKNAKARELFEREASLLMSLRHEGIAAIKDYFVEQGRHYMALEYIEGVSMRQYIRERGPVDEKRAAAWLLRLSAILDYLHDCSPP